MEKNFDTTMVANPDDGTEEDDDATMIANPVAVET
jgi:hypothetical protein